MECGLAGLCADGGSRRLRTPAYAWSRAAAASRYAAFVDSGSYETTPRAPCEARMRRSSPCARRGRRRTRLGSRPHTHRPPPRTRTRPSRSRSRPPRGRPSPARRGRRTRGRGARGARSGLGAGRPVPGAVGRDAARRGGDGWRRASSRARLACRRAAEKHPAGGAARRARGRRAASTPRSTSFAPGAAAPTSRSSTSSRRRPSGGGHQFLRALVRELEGRGLEVEVGTISGGTPVCLFNSFNFDFRRLRRFARPRCADGAPGRRADRRVPGVRRRHRRADRRGQRRARVRDDLPVGVLAREASRARLRAARAGRHPERGRPGDLPSPDEPRSAGG